MYIKIIEVDKSSGKYEVVYENDLGEVFEFEYEPDFPKLETDDWKNEEEEIEKVAMQDYKDNLYEQEHQNDLLNESFSGWG